MRAASASVSEPGGQRMPHIDSLIPGAVDLNKKIREVDARHILNNGVHWPSLVVEIVVCQRNGLALHACIISGKAWDLCDQIALQVCAPARTGKVLVSSRASA